MKLEYTILDHLNDHDNGKYIDITFIDEDYNQLKRACNSLNGRNLIIIDKSNSRDFEAFGISNQRITRIKAKIKMNGKIYLHTIKNNNGDIAIKNRKKKSWSLSYFFNF